MRLTTGHETPKGRALAWAARHTPPCMRDMRQARRAYGGTEATWAPGCLCRPRPAALGCALDEATSGHRPALVDARGGTASPGYPRSTPRGWWRQGARSGFLMRICARAPASGAGCRGRWLGGGPYAYWARVLTQPHHFFGPWVAGQGGSLVATWALGCPQTEICLKLEMGLS